METEKKYLTVTALNRYISKKIELDVHLNKIFIKGEISNFKLHQYGTMYFRIKDENSQIDCIMFESNQRNLNFKPKDGDKVLIEGQVKGLEKYGTYSIQVANMELDGVGKLFLEYEKLKKELFLKGYFDEKHKKIIPKFPKVIGVVTSETGAVIQDIKTTISRRYKLAEIYLYPCAVQGNNAKYEIAAKIKKANIEKKVDVLIVGRGGGSIEDLWPFNEIEVIEAIFNSKIPIITAIGHETDTTLSDYVSDKRAATPTGAAEIATPNSNDLIELINSYYKRINININNLYKNRVVGLDNLFNQLLKNSPKQKLKENNLLLNKIESKLESNYLVLIKNKYNKFIDTASRIKKPEVIYNESKNKITNLNQKLSNLYINLLNEKINKNNLLINKLKILSPLNLLEKGYIVAKKDGIYQTSVKNINIGDKLNLNFKDGNVITEVIGKELKNGK